MKKEKKNAIGVTPLHDRVLIREIDDSGEKKTDLGIIIPGGTKEDRGAKEGIVVAVGPGKMDDGEREPMSVKKGDKVLFQWGDKVTVEGEEYFIVRESEIIAIIN